MEKERLPDPGNQVLDTSSTEDKISAYDAVAAHTKLEYSQLFS